MNIKSVSGIAYGVRNLEVTADFYASLGFRPGKQEGDSILVYMNWFWLEFYGAEERAREGGSPVEGAGRSNQEVLLYLSVDDLAEAYRELEERGLNPSPVVVKKGRGRSETSICDPDGYRLVFFQKK